MLVNTETSAHGSQIRRAERPVAVKLPLGDFQHLQALALLADTTVAEQIRQGLDEYVDMRLSDPSLSEQIERARNRHDEVLERLNNPSSERSAENSSEEAPARPGQQKALTLRVSNKQFDLLTAIALLDAGTIADKLREAVSGYLDERLSSAGIRAQLEELQRAQARVLSPMS